MDGHIAPLSRSTAARLLSVASGVGAPDDGCAHGPRTLRENGLSVRLESLGLPLRWHPPVGRAKEETDPFDVVAGIARRLAAMVHDALAEGEQPVVLGGDHSCAIGTWNGVYHHLRDRGPMGLVWVDAHLDAHTPETTPSGKIHGMPLAVLLGHGDDRLTRVSQPAPALRPEHVCIVGARSYEDGEAALLERLGVRVVTMEEVDRRGLDRVLDEAMVIATRGTAGFGLSIDVDAVDPNDAPGVACPVPDGIRGEVLLGSLRELGGHPRPEAIEIVEYNPARDRDHSTRQLVEAILVAALA